MTTRTINSVYTGYMTKINQVPVGNIAKFNGVTWELNYPHPYNDSTSGYSAMFDDASDTHLRKENFGSPTNLTKHTFSCWVKLTNFGTLRNIFDAEIGNSANDRTLLRFNAANRIQAYHKNNPTESDFQSKAMFDDTAGWYHICYHWDTTSGTAADRIPKIWVNGKSIADELGGWNTSSNNLAQNDGTRFAAYNGGGSRSTRIGCYCVDSTSENFEGYMCDVYSADGYLIAHTEFGEEVNGIWVPKTPSITYGNNGFHLGFETDTAFGDDTSGNTNDFTQGGFGTDHQFTDTPETNYCVLNDHNKRADIGTWSNGALDIADTSSSNWHTCAGTMAMPTGKWYWECKLSADTDYAGGGVLLNGEVSGDIITADTDIGANASIWAMYSSSIGSAYTSIHNSTSYTDTNLANVAANDVMMFAYDADTGKLWFGVNGTWANWGSGVGDPANGNYPAWTISNPEWYDVVPFASVQMANNYPNFGQRNGGFAHTPPTGFTALNNRSKNFSVSDDIYEPMGKGWDVQAYIGNDTNPRSFTVGFQPDIVWVKNRSATYWWICHDSEMSDNQHVYCNESNAVSSASANGYIDSIDANGFTVNAGATDDRNVNNSGEYYYGFSWHNSATYGFELVSYEGTGSNQNISHNLGAAPELIVIKDIDNAYNWIVYHHHALSKSDPETDYGDFDTTDAWADANTVWNDTAPTATQFSVGTALGVNANNATHHAWLWRSIPGYSKVFSYYGNGSGNGPYIHTGFRPGFVMITNATDAGVEWEASIPYQVTVHGGYNFNTSYVIYPSGNNVEAGGDIFHFRSNGFNIRSTANSWNGNNDLIVGIAFAYQPGPFGNAI